jgi:hypothetical protein
MAWWFQLAAEIGDDRAAAEAIARHFDGITWQVPGEDAFETTIHAGAEAGATGRWWALAVPSGLSTSGSGDPRDARRMTGVGLLLLERLRSAPPYRFAGVGVEVFDFRDVEDLPEVLDSPALNGFVLSDPLWLSFGRPSLFVPFAPGYHWRPYLGEMPLSVGSR